MFHSWKMMRLGRCQLLHTDRPDSFRFPNGIRVNGYLWITVSMEFAGLVESLLDGWEPSRKTDRKKGTVQFQLNRRSLAIDGNVKGEFQDLMWELYTLGS